MLFGKKRPSIRLRQNIRPNCRIFGFGRLPKNIRHTPNMCRKITSHWQPLFSKKMAAAASFSYKIGGSGLIFQQNWRRRQGFGNITGGCSDMVWILGSPQGYFMGKFSPLTSIKFLPPIINAPPIQKWSKLLAPEKIEETFKNWLSTHYYYTRPSK